MCPKMNSRAIVPTTEGELHLSCGFWLSTILTVMTMCYRLHSGLCLRMSHCKLTMRDRPIELWPYHAVKPEKKPIHSKLDV